MLYVKGDKPRIWVLGYEGACVIEMTDGQWEAPMPCMEDVGFASRMVASDSGEVWLEGGRSRVLRMTLGEDGLVHLDTFGAESGLIDQWVNIFKLQGEVFFIIDNQVLAFDEESQLFGIDPYWNNTLMAYGERTQRPLELEDGSIFIPHEKGITQLIRDGDGYHPSPNDFELLAAINMFLFPDKDGRVWVTTAGDTFLVDPHVSLKTVGLQAPQITQAFRRGSSGTEMLFSHLKIGQESVKREWSHSRRILEFTFFTSDFHLIDSVWHEYKLEGLTEEWSEPFKERRVSFTNLSEGDYVLKVRAVDDMDRVGPESSFAFTILPPFYRSVWAIAFYVLVVILLLYLGARILLHRHAKEKRRLQKLVGEQTSALQHALNDAERANAAKSLFLANMSHEIRTPLNAVIGLTQVLRKTPLSELQKEHLQTIHDSGEGLLYIINDILDFSKLDAGQWEPELTGTFLSEELGSVVNLFEEQVERKGIELNYLISEEAEACFICDPLRLKQVLMNLISNAVKFTKHGEVYVSAHIENEGEKEGMLNLSVRDTGIGIEQEGLNRLFKVFSQVDSSTTRNYGGTGLGLAISRQIITLLGGSIECKSQVGEGSCFDIFLPFQRSDEEPPKELQYEEGIGSASAATMGLSHRTEQIVKTYLQRWGLKLVGTEHLEEVDLLVADFRGASVNPKLPESIAVVELVGLNQQCLRPESLLLHRPVHPDKLLRSLSLALRGERTTETVSMPASEDAKLAESCPLSILVVEDNKVNQRVLQLLLKNKGYRSKVANHGGEVLSILEQEPVDLILMDLQMPVMDGISTTLKLREKYNNPSKPWVVAQTASVLPEVRQQVLESGMNDLIPKPIKEDALEAVIRKAWAAIASREARK